MICVSEAFYILNSYQISNLGVFCISMDEDFNKAQNWVTIEEEKEREEMMAKMTYFLKHKIE